MYLYKTIISKSQNGTQEELDSFSADKTDFETNYKSQAVKVDEVILAETTYLNDLSYSAFKAKVALPLAWSDVKYVEDNVKYVLNLLSDNPI